MLDHLDPDSEPRPRRWVRAVVVLGALLAGSIALGAVPVDVAPAGAVTDPECVDDGEIATDEIYVPELQGCTQVVNPAYCYDGLSNTADVGTPETGCEFPVLPVGSTCNDLIPETAPDTIDADGFCGGPIIDGTPCGDGWEAYYQDGVCRRVGVDGTACDDFQAATVNDVYVNGVCTGIVSCDDGNIATRDIVDPATGECAHPSADGVACSDGDATTIGDRIENFECVPGTERLVCPDTPGLSVVADPLLGCLYTPLTGPCDDGNAGTTGDQYVAGQCVGTPIDCDDSNPATADAFDTATGGCAHVPIEGAACDDANPVTGDDAIVNGTCVGIPGCNDFRIETLDRIDPETGRCVHTSNDGAACSDGNAATVGDTVLDFECVPGAPLQCPERDGLVNGVADPVRGCVYEFATGPCDDGRAQTVDDRWSNGVCVGTIRTGPCDDGSPATVGDQYVNGVCIPGPLKNCSDGDPNTADSVDMVTGDCIHQPPPDGTGCIDGDSTTLNDVFVDGRCVGTPIDCDDANPFTVDTRVPNVGCRHTPLPDGTSCDDGNPATIGDVIVAGVCKGTLRTGPCDDGSPATVGDQYINGVCVPGPLKNCSDGNPNTQDILDMATGDCLHPPLPDGTSCDDGDVTTFDDAMSGGNCIGTPVNCDDGNPNTVDTRVPFVGCTHTPVVLTCAGRIVTVDLSQGQRPTAGDDVILGTSRTDLIDARGGNDVICGLGGGDIIDAGSGDDIVDAGDGNDLVSGGTGADRIVGGAGLDLILGDRGADELLGDAGADLLLGGDGVDDIDGGAGVDTCGRDQRRDRLVSCALVIPG